MVADILQNNERAWRYICRNMKLGFMSTVRKGNLLLTPHDLEDIFQESCVTLMHCIKGGKFEPRGNNSVFNFLVKIGDNTARNQVRKKSHLTFEETMPEADRKSDQDFETPIDEKQRTQDEFLDRVYNSIPSDCRRILKMFYWDHKPMDDIACIMGMKNADSAITKKSKCMKKFKDIANMLIENDEFAEEVVRNAVERAALRELLDEERINSDEGFKMAAYETDDER